MGGGFCAGWWWGGRYGCGWCVAMTFIGFTVNLIMIIIIFSISVAVTIIIIWGFVQFNIFQIRVQLGTNFMV